MIKFQISLDEATFRALHKLAGNEYLNFRAQAALLIRLDLEKRGLLQAKELSDRSNQKKHAPGNSECSPLIVPRLDY